MLSRRRPTPSGRIRFFSIPVVVPEGGVIDKETEDALFVQAVHREAARRGILLGPSGRAVEAQSAQHIRSHEPPDPGRCSTARQFLDCMRELRLWAGRPSFIGLEKLAAAANPPRELPHSTLARILHQGNTTRMPSHSQMTAFVLACGLSEEQWRDWSAAWTGVQSFALYSVQMRLWDMATKAGDKLMG